MLDEKWTGRMTPGLADLAGSPDLINKHIMKLINFAKDALDGEEDNWYIFYTTNLFYLLRTKYIYLCFTACIHNVGPITPYF